MNKKPLIVGGVGLKPGRIKFAQQSMIALATDLNNYLVRYKFLDGAPFSTIHAIFRYGNKYSKSPTIKNIDSKHDELPVTVEVPLDDLQLSSLDEVTQAFTSVLIPALRFIGIHFNLSPAGLDQYCRDRELDF